MSTANEWDIEIPSFGEDKQGDGLPRIQWVNGDVKARTIGHFFVGADRLPDGYKPGAPWKESSEVWASGEETGGWAAEMVKMLIITSRQQPYYTDDRGNKVWLDSWDADKPGIRMHADILCLIEGMEDFGPMVLSTNSTLVALAFTASARGKRQGIIPTLRDNVISVAERAAKKRLDSYCFWAPVGGEVDEKGKAMFTQTKNRPVHRPVLRLPAGDPLAVAKQLFVGRDRVQAELVPLREEYESWRTTKMGNAAADESAGSGRNSPQPLPDDLF